MGSDINIYEELPKYLSEICSFEGNNNTIDNNKKFQMGYIIDLKEYIDLKNNIHYYELINGYINIGQKFLNNKIKDLIEKGQIKDITKIEEKIFQNSSDLKDKINKKQQYILINEKLGKLLCKKDKGFYKYFIEDTKIRIFFNDTYIDFKNNKNILNENSLLNDQNNKNLFDYIEAIIEYYNFTNKIEINLQNNAIPNEIKELGYLVEEKWIENWKKYVFYENIKENYLKKYTIIDINKRSEIIQQISDFYKKLHLQI